MENVATAPATLTELRESRNIPIRQIIEKATEVLPTFPQTHPGYLGIEEHGTKDYYKIRALASVFGMEPDDFAPLVLPKKKCS
jgi:hypothetical protein